MSKIKTTWIKIGVAVLAAVLSIFVAGRIFTSPNTYKGPLQYLDEKKIAVLELAGAATATSVAISAIPDDTATPIAEEIADLGTYFLLIITAIVLEKHLMTLTGYAVFYFLIPLACVLYIIYLAKKNGIVKVAAIKIAVFSAAIFLLVPVSVGVAQLIDETYDYTASQSVEITEQDLETDDGENEEAPPAQEDKSWWNKFADKLSDIASDLKEGVTGTVETVKEKLKTVLNNFIDALAVLIVTSCVIPIVILLCFVWLVKQFFGLDFDAKRPVNFVVNGSRNVRAKFKLKKHTSE